LIFRPDYRGVTVKGFEPVEVDVGDTTIAAWVSGRGPALALLHGFPETHLMWRDVGASLAAHFTVVCADLRGYGASGCPPSDEQHLAYSKRVMARDVRRVMTELGFDRFAVAGHDRGGRVAYRLALDHPDVVDALAVLDVIPILDSWERADHRLALAFWPWSLLAQDEPLPERLLAAAPEAIIEHALGAWGSDASCFPPSVRTAYADALRDPAHAHAICEEYRAAATIDPEHDAADRRAGRQIACPALALWSVAGGLNAWYEEAGGPLAIWRMWAQDVRGEAVDGGHFFPEEHPDRTAAALRRFLQRSR
jgi:haloacetate dehalogenase